MEHSNPAGPPKQAHYSRPSVQPAQRRDPGIPRGLVGAGTARLELQPTLRLNPLQAR
ncbi:hypothetical protein Zm00014a_007236 [Zea mays]|uniref:Uncharacterized protein n=1 Tax=Zea mays TaxID=4577 RepID=A0A3L6E591_MAIZE|nr:hypothetical protein Zm00014a_007236 [Zea mays]